METRRPRYHALLIAGRFAGRAGREAPPMLRMLGRIGEALLAAGAGWRITRLDPHGAGDAMVTPANAERALRGIERDAPDVALVVAAGSIVVMADGEPALLTDRAWGESALSGEGAIPLAMLRAAHRASHLIIIVAGWSIEPPARDATARWLAVVETRRPTDLVAVGADARVIEALHGGLVGGAIDGATGTITVASLGEHLARRVPSLAIASSSHAMELGRPPIAASTLRSRSSATMLEPDDLTGTTLPGRFRLDARLAGGGFGTVYRAKQLAVARDVAVKVLHGDLDASSSAGRLFVHEIQSVGRIDHPNVVRIHHADITPEGRPFFAMELLDGRDLEQIIASEGRLSIERAVALGRQLLLGLGAAHAAGLVHADIKPANAVIVAGQAGERLVLVDFGLSRLHVAESASLSVGGTPAYMAPEQLSDERIDARSDLFSTALVLVTLLTGWRRRTQDELVPPLEDVASPALREVLRRALALDPDARYQTALEMEDALAAAIATSSVPTPPPRRRIAPYVALGIAAVAGTVALTVFGRDASRQTAAQPAPASSTTEMPDFPARPTIVVGGSGTLLWGFFAPLASFLEISGELVIPITSQNDVGSGGALNALRAGTFDIALLSRRAAPDTLADARAAGKVLVEVAIGFDETALFVHRDNPIRSIDVADLRAHLCCGDGELLRPFSWAELGAATKPLSTEPVSWIAFGRTPDRKREVTTATLALADEWLCAPARLCASDIDPVIQANEVLPTLVKDARVLALSSRSFATDQVAAVVIRDREHHTRLDGRKAFWIYALVDAQAPIPPSICRLFRVVLDPSVAERLSTIGKAAGLPDALRVRQRAALGLDDGTCGVEPATSLADADHRVLSPIGDELEVPARWIPDVSSGGDRNR